MAANHGKPKRGGRAMAGGTLAPATISALALGMWATGPPEVHVLAVGNGQAVLFRSAQGAILVDAGASPATLKDELGQILPPWQSGLEAGVITAPGLGHIGGFPGPPRPAPTRALPPAPHP